MSYSSQKSCVKIWFGLVEPFKSYYLNFLGGGGRNPLLGGLHVTCDAHFELGRAIPVKSHVSKFGSNWLSFQELSCPQTFFRVGRNPIRVFAFDL